MTAFLIAGRRLDLRDPDLERAAALAHALRERPRCLCCDDAPAMYVSRSGRGFAIKRMPNTGANHAPHCPSSHPAVAPIPGRASDRARRPFRPFIEDPRLLAQSRSLLHLLQSLWQAAGLTRWHPGFEGKRNWVVVRRRLLTAAAHLQERDDTLLGLYVPEVFRLEQKDAIRARRVAFWEQLEAWTPHPRHLLLVGELKNIRPTSDGYAALVKHLPALPLRIGDPLFRFAKNAFGPELAHWGTAEQMHMAISAQVDVSTPIPEIVCLALMPLTHQWLPAGPSSELVLPNTQVRKHGPAADPPKTHRLTA